LGYFRLGSTVILCLPPRSYALHAAFDTGATLRMGVGIGRR
jgi:hypothetical protein